MPILLILLLSLACLPESWPRPGKWIAAPGHSIALTWMAVGMLISFAYLIAGRARHCVEKKLLSRSDIFRQYFRGRRIHFYALVAVYLCSLYLFGYGWGLYQVWSRNGHLLPGVDLLLLAPFIVALLLSWSGFYSAERALDELDSPGRQAGLAPGRWAYVFFHARQNLALILLPVTLLLLEKELRRQVPAWEQTWNAYGNVLGILLAVLIFFSMPWLLRWILGLEPLPQGPLRARLIAATHRLGIRCNNILIWRTRNGVANAMVVGALPFLRYILLSDRLIEELEEEEVEAVLGHEIGHIKHNHMLFYLLFLLASISVFGLAISPFVPHLDQWLGLENRQDLAALPIVAALGAYIFLVFGFLSRRCERQADIYGCRTVSCADFSCQDHSNGEPLVPRAQGICPTGIRIFCSALDKVALINGVNREKPGFLQSWQHSTIARRVDFLHSLMDDPRQEERFQRRVLLLKCGLFLALGLVVLLEMIPWH